MDFGADPTGVADSTAAIQAALAAAQRVKLPKGTYLISSTLTLGYGQVLEGDGHQNSILSATTAITMVAMTSSYAMVRDLQIAGDVSSRTPLIGLTLYGASTFCIQNTVTNIIIQNVQRGIVLDGYTSLANPCYWNRIDNVTVLKPAIDGVLLTKSGAGDTPNANVFTKVHVYSNTASISGSGFYVQYGNYNNSFTDCESGLSTTTPTACFRVGANAALTRIINQYCETSGAIANLQLDAGSTGTTIINLLAVSAGAAIYDLSSGAYSTFNAGYPTPWYSGASVIQSTQTGKVLYDYDGAATTPASVTFYEHRYRNAIPTTGAFNRSAVVWNTNVGVSNGPTGWVCTTGGTPGTWMAFGERYLEGSVTFNPGLVATGAQSALSTMTVTGANLSDVVTLSSTVDMQGMVLFGYVSAANTVKVGALNLTGAGVTLSSGTVYARVHPR